MIENEVVEFIAQVGFPIVAFLLLWYSNNKVISKNTEALQDLARLIRGKF